MTTITIYVHVLAAHRSQCPCGKVTAHSQHTHGTLTAHSPPTHRPPVAMPLWWKVTAHSRYTHRPLTAHSQHTQSTLTAHRSQCPRGGRSQHTHSTLTAHSRHTHRPPVAMSLWKVTVTTFSAPGPRLSSADTANRYLWEMVVVVVVTDMSHAYPGSLDK